MDGKPLITSNMPTCSICLEDFSVQSGVSVHKGGELHLFHPACIDTWINGSNIVRACPACNLEITHYGNGEKIPAHIPRARRQDEFPFGNNAQRNYTADNAGYFHSSPHTINTARRGLVGTFQNARDRLAYQQNQIYVLLIDEIDQPLDPLQEFLFNPITSNNTSAAQTPSVINVEQPMEQQSQRRTTYYRHIPVIEGSLNQEGFRSIAISLPITPIAASTPNNIGNQQSQNQNTMRIVQTDRMVYGFRGYRNQLAFADSSPFQAITTPQPDQQVQQVSNAGDDFDYENDIDN